MVAGSDGAVWFTYVSDLDGNGGVGRITTSGQTTEYPISTPNGFPFNITAGPDGALWFTEPSANKIGRITTSGDITEYPLPDAGNVGLQDITTGPDGALWFTEDGGSAIGRITTSGQVNEFPIPTTINGVHYVPGPHPFGITTGPDGALWFTTYPSMIGRITTSGSITMYPVPDTQGGPYYITTGSDGALWFTANNEIGRMTTSGELSTYHTSGSPTRIVAGLDGNLWASDVAGAIDQITTSGMITTYATQQSVSDGLVFGPDNAWWFPETKNNAIGRLSFAAILPSAPTNLKATSPTQNPSLTWDAVSGANFYNIYRNGSLIDTISSSTTTYTDTNAPESTDSYNVTAVNGGGESSQSNSVSVLVDRTAPTITYTVGPTSNSNGWNNSSVTVTFTCADNATGPAGSGIATCTPPQTKSTDGTYTITGTAVDNVGNTTSVNATVKIDLTAPMVGTASWSTNPVVAGSSSTLTVPAVPSDGSPITGGEYYYGNTDPGQGNGNAMTYSSDSGNLAANVGGSLMPGSYQIHFRAQNAAGTWSPTASTTLVVTPVPIAPTITSANNYSIGVRQIITPSDFTFTATGTPTPTLSETGVLPSGLSFTDNGNGTANFTGMVAAGTAGSYPVTIHATSSAGTVTQTFTLTINNTDSAPTTVFTSTGSDTMSASVGSSASFTLTATGNGKNSKIFVFSGTLPPGLNLHDNKDGTASITGTPTHTGTYTFTVEAQNKQGVTYQQFTIVVS